MTYVPFGIFEDDPTFRFVVKAIACGDDGDEHAHIEVNAAWDAEKGGK